METAFDRVAEEYDSIFTDSCIGKAQRKIVWSYVDNILKDKKELNILELNCGTGEDAIHFARMGHNVLATDQSISMLKITRRKVESEKLNDKINIRQLDILQISKQEFEQKFDLIFSNFGGINCVGNKAMITLSHILSGLLNSNGRVIFILMPKFCLMESFYFLLKLKFNKITRRASTKPLQVNINGGTIQTFYYSPKEISRIFSNNFSINYIKPVGFFIPPSFLNTFFATKQKSFNLIIKFEQAVSNLSILSKLADHFLIDWELKR